MAIPIIGGIIKDVIGGARDVISEVVVDKDKQIEANLRLKELEDRANERLHEQNIAQTEVNKVEAQSGSIFVAGWRPFVGWVGGVGLAYSAILQPFLNWASRVNGYTGSLPALDDTTLIMVLSGMLGIGAMRTFEKAKGVSTNDFTDVPRQELVEGSKVVVPSETGVKPEKKGFKL